MNQRNLFNKFIHYFQTINSRKTKIPWWVKITTDRPNCIYYFGPFDDKLEATKMQFGYIEDLMAEKAGGITAEIEQTNPNSLTTIES